MQPEYLVVPNNCNCSWISPAVAVTKVGIVRSIDYDYQYAVGRKDIGSGRVAVTTVRTTDWRQWHVDINGNLQADNSPNELLVCETI